MLARRTSLLLCALAAAGFVFGTAIIPPLGNLDRLSTVLRGLTFLTFVLVGAVIIHRHSRHVVGWLFVSPA